MAMLRFEIWRDDAESEQSVFEVNAQNDRVRAATMPNAVLVHSYDAASEFEAFQQNHQWNGWGDWKPEPNWTDRNFTDAEADAQRSYLAERSLA